MSVSEGRRSYNESAAAVIRDLLLEFECQPILFVGSGMSRRYFSAPDWRELLRVIASMLPDGERLIEYLLQKRSDDLVRVGTDLSDSVFEWAWNGGREHFPPEIFSGGRDKSHFIKHLVAEHFRKITPLASSIGDPFRREIEALQAIRPHAVITTNYDLFLESVFSGYERVTGQTIIKHNTNSYGEIFHIHGDVSAPDSLVLTQADYDEWNRKKKYVSAKLLTFFAEHPVFVFGYGMSDPNVRSVMGDIGELVATDGRFINNIVQIFWRRDEVKNPSDQAMFSVDGVEYRTRAIHTSDFRWIFDALKSRSALTSVNPRLVRALAARTVKLIRQDLPSGVVKVDYDLLERVAGKDEELPKLLGISIVSSANESHPFILSQVAKRIKVSGWHEVNKLIHRIKAETGVDIRSTDNKYHCRIKTGQKETSHTRKWSQLAVDLFMAVKEGKPYDLGL